MKKRIVLDEVLREESTEACVQIYEFDKNYLDSLPIPGYIIGKTIGRLKQFIYSERDFIESLKESNDPKVLPQIEKAKNILN